MNRKEDLDLLRRIQKEFHEREKFHTGDKVVFIVDFDKKECEIVISGFSIGVVFTNIFDELIPVISVAGTIGTLSIQWAE